jgi:steroid delta-isomerase-like uncharacterized protein
MSEQNKAVVRRFVDEVWNRGNLDVIDEIVAADYVDHSPGTPPGMTQGRAAVRQFAVMFREAFPDVRGEIEELLAEGTYAVVRWTARATHQGEFLGVPASSRQVTVTGTSIYRLVGAQIAEEWTHADMLGLLQQIGAVPELATA